MATKSRRDSARRLAARQHGVIARAQLRAAGIGDGAIAHAIRIGRLHRVFRGVYAWGVPDVGWRGRIHAAVLACGKGAVASHRSAAALLGLVDEAPVVVDVIAPPSRGRNIDGIRLHRVRPPRPEEIRTVAGIPCTSPARTLVDYAGSVGERSLRSAFERAAQKRILDIPAIEAAADPGRLGARALVALVEEWRLAASVARRSRLKSPLEAKVLPLLIQRRLPQPLANAPVEIANGRIEVDFLWPLHRLVVEADSRDFHGTEVAFERDRWRDRELLHAGYTSLRVTSLQAEQEPGAVAGTIVALLTRAPVS
jgi:very-short-patch-repair endonuclease